MRWRGVGQTGVETTEIGFGAAGIGNLYRPVGNVVALQAVETAWDEGIRYFDTAPHYGVGLSERRLGLALHGKLQDGSCVLSTKAGRLLSPLAPGEERQSMGFVEEPPFKRRYDYSYDGIMRSFEFSCQRLGCERLDILLMHDIGRLTHGRENDDLFAVAMESGYRAMDELRSQGLVKAIGLGVNEWQVCDATFQYGDFDCFMVANCVTLLNNDIFDSFVGKCVEKKVSLIAAAPFNSGILAKGSAGGGHFFYGDVPKEVVEKVVKMEEICSEFGVPLPAAALHFPLLFPVVCSVLIGMSNSQRVVSNLAWYNTSIPDELWTVFRDRGLIDCEIPGT